MSSRHADDEETRLAWLLSQFQDQQTVTPDPQALDSLEDQLNGLTIDELEELVDGNDCLRLLQDLSATGHRTTTTEPQPPLAVEKIGKYAVKHKIGSGGFADVYFATDTRLEPVSYTHLTLPTICSV